MQENLPLPLPFPAHETSMIHALHVAISACPSRIIAEDILKKPLSYKKFWWRMHLLAGVIEKNTPNKSYVGVLMPTSLAGAVTFFALHYNVQIPVMLNFSAGLTALKSAVETTEIKTILTSRQFIEKAELGELVAELSNHATIIYLEDLRAQISKASAMISLLRFSVHIPKPKPRVSNNDPAVILFTSGSEGVPKGVVLSHHNILANVAQANAILKFNTNDRMFSCLPIFHSFGLVAGAILPLLLGIRVFFYPSPLHYKQIPTLCREAGSTILLGTDTFLRNYAATAKDEDFKTLRLIVAGAEKLKEATSELYQKRFDIEIMQGYGVTETSPVLACNVPESNKRGTVGKILPHMYAKLEPVEGIAKGGTLLVKGPNVMLGYMKHDKPTIIQPQGEWYDTGDICEIDEEGYISIVGRAKRFAKVGGEMVSLAVVEEMAYLASAEAHHAAIAIADERKGEQIILITEDSDLTREHLIATTKAKNQPELYIPRKVTFIDELPRLGNGKVDYMALKRMQ